MKYFILVFLIIHCNTYCQGQNREKVKMNRYEVSDNLKAKLKDITGRISEYSKLFFILKVTKDKDDEYLIPIETVSEVNMANEHKNLGFFNVDGKLFLVFGSAPEIFFKNCGKETISVNVKKKNKKDPKIIVEPYIDELPAWIIRYESGKFINVFP